MKSFLFNEHRIFGGLQRYYEHESEVIGLPMRFSVFLPPQAEARAVPAVLCLAGLTCNEETFMVKAGAQRAAARLGMALITPDTSPRGAAVAGESEHWDFGVGAGFYLDATQKPWALNWRMESYLIEELLPMVAARLPVDPLHLGILGHSMGGHGALTLGLRHPSLFCSVSALAPICAPSHCPWGQKAFSKYLGEDRALWADHDASALMRKQTLAPFPQGILVDQGLADKFLAEQLHPHLFEEACEAVGQPLTLRRHEGYDHGYYFISTFIESHLEHHAKAMGLGGADGSRT